MLAGTSASDGALGRRARCVRTAAPAGEAVGAGADVTAALLAHLTGAAVLLALGVMLAAVGSLVVGVLALVGGGAWLVAALRRL